MGATAPRAKRGRGVGWRWWGYCPRGVSRTRLQRSGRLGGEAQTRPM